MVANRILRATGCASCRLSLLRSFTSVGGHNFRLAQTIPRPRNYSRLAGHQARLFSQQAARRQEDKKDSEQARKVAEFIRQNDLEQEQIERRSKEEALEEEEDVENDLLEDELEESTEVNEFADRSQEASTVPWYLQVESPEKSLKPLSERQRLPDLPIHSPPILESLLKTVSLDLGIDDLTLIDLRKLDPPPALGANLVMIIGTARSEKHLHVSADRLCRWLRSNYKLRPNADGLLGRNELKLKLKRKAKRAKLMGRVQDENADDGIRTGWVCVDVGVVEGAEGSEPVVEKKNFVGFGRKTDGVRMVVQMLTEEKRAEMELERLWQGILDRATNPPGEAIEDGGEDTNAENAIGSATAGSNSTARLSAGTISTGPTKREYHTSARRLQTAQTTQSQMTPNHDGSSENDVTTDTNTLYNAVMESMAIGQYEEARLQLVKGGEQIKELAGDGWRTLFQEKLFSHAQSLPGDEARLCLGSGSTDYSSTSFLTSFYASLTPFPTVAEVDARVWLYSFAQTVGHPGYKASGLKALFSELQASGVEISPIAYKQILRGLLTPEPKEDGTLGTSQSALLGAMDVLQSMHNRGLPILDEDLLVDIQEATAVPPNDDFSDIELQESPETYNLPSTPATPIQRRLHLLMMAIDLPCFRDESRLRLLNLYRGQNNWLEFWDTWRMAPKRGASQSPLLYAFMFGSVAKTRHQKGCMNVLRTWTPEMQLENPPISKEGQVAMAIRACIKIVDPFVEEDLKNNPGSKNEWLKLWMECQPEKGDENLMYN